MEKIIRWERFWCPLNGFLHLDDKGFLLDPEDEYSKYFQFDHVGFETIQDKHCLILLGEPGIGKSIAVKEQVKIANSCGIKATYFDLKDYNSEQLLRNELFESEMWDKFKKSDEPLHLFLDSLDEARIAIPTIASLINREILKLKCFTRDRFFLRVACRTREWPTSLEEKLKSIWEQDEISTYELTPLRMSDVKLAAGSYGLDEDAFLREVSEKNAVPLASRPITLFFMLDIFLKVGCLPSSQSELYNKGCLHLCEEHSIERIEKGDVENKYVGNLTSQQRIEEATRIAALLLLCGKKSVFIGKSSELPTDDTLRIDDLDGCVDSGNINETLGTALFTSRGSGYFGFAHQRFLEHLTAEYLKSKPLDQIRNIFENQKVQDAIPPQLQETVAIIASQRPDVFEWVMEISPSILLRSELANSDGEYRYSLVRLLLDNIEDEKIIDYHRFHSDFKKLSHPKLAEQLLSVISDRGKKTATRLVAIEMAEACGVAPLQEALAKIALDKSEEYYIRDNAASAVYNVADNETKKKLEPLARGEAGDDPDDQLKAYGLRYMWPNHWGIIDLLKNITPPKRDHFIGSYYMFLKADAPQGIKAEINVKELPDAISIISQWNNDSRYKKGYDETDNINDEIVRAAWTRVDHEPVIRELANLVISRGKVYMPICFDKNIWNELFQDENNRHAIISYIIDNNDLADKDLVAIFVSNDHIMIYGDDFPWLLEQIKKAEDSKQEHWARLLRYVTYSNRSSAEISEFLELRSNIKLLEESFPIVKYFQDEDVTRTMEMYAKQFEREERKNVNPDMSSIIENIKLCITEIESGNTNDWYELTKWISINPKTDITYEWPDSLENTPIWKLLVPELQERIRIAATAFLQDFQEKNNQRYGSWTWEENSVNNALLLISEYPDMIDNVPGSSYEKLANYVIDIPSFSNRDGSRCKLFEIVYHKAKPAMIEAFTRRLEYEDDKHKNIFFLNDLGDCWNHDLSEAVLGKMTHSELSPLSYFTIGDFLIKRNDAAVESVVIDQFQKLFKTGETTNALFIESATIILCKWSEKYWEQIWGFLNKEDDTSAKIIERIAHETRHKSNSIFGISEARLAKLYCCICKLFPIEEDPEPRGSVTPRMEVVDFRRGLLDALTNRGTQGALSEISSLIEKLPSQGPVLKWRLEQARSVTAQKTWSPLQPKELIDLLEIAERRYVENEEQLLSVVISSLKRMEDHYQTSNAVETLWNYEGSGNSRRNFTPKDEESLSDEIKRWIDSDLSSSRGIIVNREVQVQRGSKTDLFINAVTMPDRLDASTLTVVIEVKGCWNKDIKTAMKKQLLERYMVQNGHRHGLYLIGWYRCDRWDDKDGRKKKTSASLGELQSIIDGQADDLKREFEGFNVASVILDLTLK